MKRFLFTALLCSSLTVPANAQKIKQLADAAKHLEHVSYFAFGGVGIAGSTSSGEKDFRIVLAQPPEDALHDFEEIYAYGNEEAKCYALVAIRKLNRERFRKLVQNELTASADVQTMQGCLAGKEKVAQVVSQIEKGAFDITAFSTLRR